MNETFFRKFQRNTAAPVVGAAVFYSSYWNWSNRMDMLMGYGFVIMLVIVGVFTMNMDMCMG
ncbi:MAG: hypothetical protein IJN58_00475, partial [Clostridia bacterium]|nr:hypothetical protein [Clostridia bacterium]